MSITRKEELLKKLKEQHPNTSLQHSLQADICRDNFPPTPTPNKKTNAVVYSVFENSKKDMGYIDLPGKFPFISAAGTQYLLVAYNVDANSITVATLKNRNAPTITSLIFLASCT